MKLNWMARLMDKAGDGTGAGASAGNSMLGGGNGAGASGGGTNANGDAGGNGNDGANGGGSAADWRAGLPKEMQDNPVLKKYTSVEALAGAYVNAQKLIGADKIPVPSKHTTDEEWNQIYRKLGLPEKEEEYAVKFKEGTSIDDDFTKAFKANAHKFGVLPKQAQALADWFSDVNINAEKAVQGEMAKQYEAGVANLKKDWGNAFDLNIARANKALSELGGKETVEHFIKSGYGGDEKVMRFLAKVGETVFGEHKVVEGQGTSSAMNPQELDAEIRRVQAEPGYYDKSHPNHKAIVKEVADLYAKRYPQTVDKT